MDVSGVLDVIIAGAGILLLLSILNEAAVEALKSVTDRKFWGQLPYRKDLEVWLIGQRFWHAAVGRIIDDVCRSLQDMHGCKLLKDHALTNGQADLALELKKILAAAPLDSATDNAGLSAEGLANIKEEQLSAALSAWLIARLSDRPVERAAFEEVWRTVEPLPKAFMASRYQLMRKAYQNRLRFLAGLIGLAMACLLFVCGQFSFYAYMSNLTRDPATRKASVAWFSQETNIDEFRKRVQDLSKAAADSTQAIERQAETLRGSRPESPARKLSDAAAATAQVKSAVDGLAKKSEELVAAMPPRTMAALAEPIWHVRGPLATPRLFVYAVLDILALALLLSFGSENWHDILNALLSVRRQFGGGATK